MKRSTSNLTRCLALVMALVLLVSNVNLGVALRAFAVEDGKTTVNAGEIVAANYELTEAEENLLKSGYLKGEVTYDTFNGIGLVDVDTEQKTITAYEANGWVPTTASIVVGEETKETIDLSQGNTYTFDGNAFAVKVAYTLDVNVDNQDALLKAAGTLKNALDTMKGAYNVGNINLGTVVLAMPTMLDVVDGIKIPFMGREFLVNWGDAATAAVQKLDAQLGEGDDKLDLQDMNPFYNGSHSKVLFMIESGEAYKAAIASTYEALVTIAADTEVMNNDMLDAYLESKDAVDYERWTTFKGIIDDLIAGLEPAVAANWDVSAVKTDLTPEQYVALDALVNAVAGTTAVTAKNPLHVADAVAQANLSMFNVAVEVMLYTVADEVGTTKQVKHDHVEKVTLTLAKDSTAADIMAAISESGVEGAAETAWGEAFVAGKYTAGGTTLPGTLTEDISFSIIYTPNPCSVTFGDGFVGEDAKTVPYGYQMMLEKHADAAQAYDYYVNGELKTQGSVVVITEDTTVTRSSGKAYDVMNLYGIIADNYANDALKAILTSGALNGNVNIALRMPDAADSEALVKLAGDKLAVVPEYSADYNGLSWIPSSYREGEGSAWLGFNGNYTVDWAPNTAKVQYVLVLDNFSEEQVAKILADAAALKDAAAGQISALDDLLDHEDTMESLTLTKFGAISGVIRHSKLNDDPVKNEQLRIEFGEIIEENIIPNNLDTNEYLKIYNLMTAYKADGSGGLAYYYRNSEAILKEVSELSEHLSAMTKDDDHMRALEILADKSGYPEYVDDIVDLRDNIAKINRDLTAPAAMIDLSSPNLFVLVEALEQDAVPAAAGMGFPYLVSETLTAVDDSVAIVQVKVTANGKTEAFTTGELVVGEAFPEAEANKLFEAIENFANINVEDPVLYQAVGMEELAAQVGQKLTQKTTNFTINYTPKDLEIVVVDEEGEEVSTYTVSVKNREITLPKHDKLGYTYEYDVFGTVISAAQDAQDAVITVNLAQLHDIAFGFNEIVRKEIHKAQEDLDEDIEAATTMEWIYDDAGNKTGLIARVAGDEDSLGDFVDELVDLDYSYYAFNGEDVLKTSKNDQDETETVISLQAFANAILKDSNFTSDMLIDLGKSGKGTVFTGTMTLGKSGGQDIFFEDLVFIIEMTSVPEEMEDIAEALEDVEEYVSFRAENGKLNVSLDLPDAAYDAYLTLLLLENEVDKTNINAINNEIAFMFLRDYIETVLNTDATTQTFQNTLDMMIRVAKDAADEMGDIADDYGDDLGDILDVDKEDVEDAKDAVHDAVEDFDKWVDDELGDIDLTEHEDTYQAFKDAIEASDINFSFVPANGKDALVMDITAAGKEAIDGILDFVGVDIEDYETELDMVKEYIDDSALTLSLVATLENTYAHYEAAVVDVDRFDADDAETALDVFDYTSDLPARVNKLAGSAVIMLLDNVDGDLNFKYETVLDLNGKTVNGNITSADRLIIIDSTLDTYNAGTVTGSVSGKVDILAGNYNVDVTRCLTDGYIQEGTTVRNTLYTLANVGNVVDINIDTNYLDADIDNYDDFTTAMVAELAVDLVLNYYACASLTLNGHVFYDIEFNDFIGYFDKTVDDAELINKALDCFHLPEMADFLNEVAEGLLNFSAIEAALKANEPVTSWTTSTAPWKLELEHNVAGDYIAFNLVTDDANAKNHIYNLRFVGDYVEDMIELAAVMDDVVEDETFVKLTNVQDMEYVDGYFVVSGGADAFISLDFSGYYPTYMGIVLAYTAEDADRRAELVDAVNSGDFFALKAAFDKVTSEDAVNALKAMKNDSNFADMMAATGINVDIDPNPDLEGALFYTLSFLGDVLRELEEDGNGTTLGELETEFGVYVYEDVGGYTDSDIIEESGHHLKYTITESNLKIKINMFCLWGDVNHDGAVDGDDATLILQHELGIAPELFCTERADVNGSGTIDGDDATLVLQHELGIISKFPVEN